MSVTSGSTPQRHVNHKAMIVSLLQTTLLDIGATIALFSIARANGASDVVAYLVSGIGPLVSIGIEYLRHRRIDTFGVAVIVLVVVSAAVSLIGSTDPKMLLLKDSVLTGAIGLAILLTLTPLFARPLMFYFGRKFGTDGTDEGVLYWNSLWKFPGFRHSQRVITAVWGVGFMVEAALKTGWVLLLPFDTAFMLNQIGPLAATIGLMVWTAVYGKKQAAAGARRAAEARIAPGAAFPEVEGTT